MEVSILKEAGYTFAVAGIGLSFGVDDFGRLIKVADKLSDKDGGHNKFLESMQVWIDIKAARYFWAEFDTYRVGTTKQSESTIHTICRTHLSQEDFEHEILPATIDYMNDLIDLYNSEKDKNKKKEYFEKIKANLPEGYLQRRYVCTNYKVLRNMIWQRRNHKLQEWHTFIDTLREELEYPDILFKGWKD
jgi:hypothetical protein